MIAWDYKQHSVEEHLLFSKRKSLAESLYFDRIEDSDSIVNGYPKIRKGYQSKLASLRNIHKDEACTIVCNGPSLAELNHKAFQNTVTIGCNGIYKLYSSWNYELDFLVFEDIQQFETRAPESDAVRRSVKMAALYNAYALESFDGWIFFNSPRCSTNGYYWAEADCYPQFSRDFASIVHLGSTVTYIMLQLAYHLGCNPIFIVGLDFDYGELSKHFPPGKITVTRENLEMVNRCHFQTGYHKIGDIIGVPWIEKQRLAFEKASEVFQSANRTVLTVGERSKLDTFNRISVSEWESKCGSLLTVTLANGTRKVINPSHHTRPIYIWGAGSACEIFIQRNPTIISRVSGIIDSFLTEEGALHSSGLPMLRPESLLSPGLSVTEARPYVIVASSFINEITYELRCYGFGISDDYIVL